MLSKDSVEHCIIPRLFRLEERAAAVFNKIPFPALLCIIVFAVFSPAIGNGFVDWDDAQYVLSNPALRGSWLDALGFSPGYYHPLSTLTYKLEFVLFGLNPFPYHFTNLMLHLTACVSAFYLLTALGARRQTAFLGALLFGIHPVHVEPAAWISGRKELLWGIFSSWTLACYLRFIDTKLKRFFIYSLAFFTFSVFSKPFAVVLPFVLLLADHYRGRAFNFRLLLEKTPYLAIALPLLTLSTSPSGFLLRSGSMDFSFFRGAALAGQNIVFYTRKLIRPVNLSALYPSPELSGNTVMGFLLLLFTILAGCLLTKALSRNSLFTRFLPAGPSVAAPKGPGAAKKTVFGLGFFLITIFPALIVSPPADRYAYLPALGLFFLYGEFIFWLYGAMRGPGSAGASLIFRRLIPIAVAGHLFILGLASARRVSVWKSSLTLWDDVLEKYPLEYMAYYGRGNARGTAGEYGKALQDFTRCLELSPRYWKALNNRGRLFADTKEYDRAIADYSAAIFINPGEARLFLNRGNAYFLKGDSVRAVEDYNSALAIAPDFAAAIENKRRAAMRP